MMYGYNFLSVIKFRLNDSVSIDFKSVKIEKCIELKENAKAIVIAGKHSGERGTIEKIDNEKKMVELKTREEKINVLIKQIIAID